MGHLSLNGWGSYDKVSCCFVWKYAQKIAGLQGSTLSDHRMTTGFGPFELPFMVLYLGKVPVISMYVSDKVSSLVNHRLYII